MLLTISIPTYNRASFLHDALNGLLSQLEGFHDLISVQVADNCSTDNTLQVVESIKAEGHSVTYFRHENNLGMDGNFTFLFENCKTEYLWMLSDDDILMPNAIRDIMEVLQKQKVGNLFLGNIWYHSDEEIPVMRQGQPLQWTKYDKPLKFIDRVNYWFTFISANIINKELLADKVNLARYQGTFLQLLAWNIPAVFQGFPNIVIDNPILLCKGDNTRGYKVFIVFGRNMQIVLKGLVEEGCDSAIISIINRHLLSSFFSMFIGKDTSSFGKESYLKILIPIYWRYPSFWRLVTQAKISSLKKFIK